MRTDQVAFWLHLLGAATWTGGLVVLAALVPALRRAGADRSILQAAARRFSVVGWAAMALAVLTGLWLMMSYEVPLALLGWKVGLVGAIVVLTAVHQLTASRTSPALRGTVQGVILLLSILTFAVAVVSFT